MASRVEPALRWAGSDPRSSRPLTVPKHQFLQLHLALLGVELRVDQVELRPDTRRALALHLLDTLSREGQLLLRQRDVLLKLRVRKSRCELIDRRSTLHELLA